MPSDVKRMQRASCSWKKKRILLWWIPNSDLLHCWLRWRSNEQTARKLVAKSYRLEIPISFLDGFVAWYNILVTCFNGFTASQPPNPTISWILIFTLRWLNFAELRQVQKCYLPAHRWTWEYIDVVAVVKWKMFPSCSWFILFYSKVESLALLLSLFTIIIIIVICVICIITAITITRS